MRDKTLENFGRRLRELRKTKGMTIEALGERAELGYKHVADLERAVKTPSFEAIGRLASALSISPHELFLPDQAASAPPAEDTEAAFRNVVQSIERHGSLELKLFLTRVLTDAANIFSGVATPISKWSGSQTKKRR